MQRNVVRLASLFFVIVFVADIDNTTEKNYMCQKNSWS